MACHICSRIILIQCEKLKNLGGLFDTSGTIVTLGLKLRDVFSYFANLKRDIHAFTPNERGFPPARLVRPATRRGWGCHGAPPPPSRPSSRQRTAGWGWPPGFFFSHQLGRSSRNPQGLHLNPTRA